MKEHLMVQEQVENVWQHMVGVMCLNLTYSCLLYTSDAADE